MADQMMLYPAIWLTAFISLCAAEWWHPRHDEKPDDDGRIGINFGLGLTSLVIAAVLPVGAVFGAELAASEPRRAIGLQAVPILIAVGLLLLARTLLNYWVHRALHRWGAGWRIHRVHHRDQHIDLSTSLRNHPVEAVVLAIVAFALSYMLQAPVGAVIAVDLILILANFWSHGNIRLPVALETALSRHIVTPGVHRVHHARDASLYGRNYGDVIMIWDRVFGTFHPPTADTAYGIEQPQDARIGLLHELASPLRR